MSLAFSLYRTQPHGDFGNTARTFDPHLGTAGQAHGDSAAPALLMGLAYSPAKISSVRYRTVRQHFSVFFIFAGWLVAAAGGETKVLL